MKETREKKIINKVFDKDKIRSIWREVNQEYKASQTEKNHSSINLTINLTIKCIDGTRYESEGSELLNDGDIIDLKKSDSISIDYYDYGLDRRISITLQHGDYGSSLIVSGKNRDWVAGAFDRLDIVLNALKPQESLLIRHKTIFLHLLALGVGFAVYVILDILLYRHISPLENFPQNILAIREFLQQNYIFYTLIQTFLFWLQGIFLALWLQSWIFKLWPSVEFDFGPDHQKVEKLRRFRVWLILTIVIAPLLVNLIYDLISSYWN